VPPSLSLRAIARDLGMVSSAIYRYFASRDELLTR
jgi:AcrR family transcriptional regulator